MAGISRRAWLARMAAGSAALASGMAQLRHALALGTVEPGVARVRGDARINGKPAQRGMEVKPGDVITTGPDAELVVVVGRDAFLVRAQSRIEFNGGQSHLLVASLRVVTGALLSVFEPDRPKQIRTPTATIGIRGTAVYVELEPSRTYVCTCYGEAELTPVDDPSAAETVRTRHHDEPRYIYPRGMPRRMEKAPVINHTDAELGMLEGLVGRTVPFDPSLYR
jgi:hypothetical protein